MNLKEFFKPTRLKLIILLALIILTLFSAASKMSTIMCIVGPCIQPWPYGNSVIMTVNDFLAWPYELIISTRHSIQMYFHPFFTPYTRFKILDNTLLISGMIVTLIWQYLIACTSLFVINKIKK